MWPFQKSPTTKLVDRIITELFADKFIVYNGGQLYQYQNYETFPISIVYRENTEGIDVSIHGHSIDTLSISHKTKIINTINKFTHQQKDKLIMSTLSNLDIGNKTV